MKATSQKGGALQRGFRIGKLGFGLVGSYLGYQAQNLLLSESGKAQRRARFQKEAGQRVSVELGALNYVTNSYFMGEPAVAMIMFQRRQDVQIMRILRGMAPSVTSEITSQRALLALVDRSPCDLLATSAALQHRCDLTKERGRGACSANPLVACHLKRHTEAMKRYGHFGKFPTSAALVLRESGAQDLNAIYTRTLAEHRSRRKRAIALETSLSRIHRVSQKIACMFLSVVSNPNLGSAPWHDGLDYRTS